MTGATVLLASAGRRPYLARWFSEAFDRLGVQGRVVLADADVHAPARAFADCFIAAPPVASGDYSRWLRETLERENIDLAISINDFELSTWARLEDHSTFDVLVRLAPSLQDAVEDKRAMANLLTANDIATPRNVPLDSDQTAAESEIVLKGRYGSGSRGLRLTQRSEVERLLPAVISEVTERDGAPASHIDEAAHLVVAQERIRGDEYGLDVVCDLDGQFASVLARKKLAMRAGETDRAVTVEPAAFAELARRLAQAIPHKGVIDVDVIVDERGAAWVIDVNPRFGGGYPFSHVAGADVPAALIAWLTGTSDAGQFLHYEPNVAGSKSVEIVRLP